MSDISLIEKNKQLQAELDAAIVAIHTLEAAVARLQNENVNNLKKFAHDLSNPLQILSMTLEALQDNSPEGLEMVLFRMKRSTDNMTDIVTVMRKVRAEVSKREEKAEAI